MEQPREDPSVREDPRHLSEDDGAGYDSLSAEEAAMNVRDDGAASRDEGRP